jgi:hypothetical protein
MPSQSKRIISTALSVLLILLGCAILLGTGAILAGLLS